MLVAEDERDGIVQIEIVEVLGVVAQVGAPDVGASFEGVMSPTRGGDVVDELIIALIAGILGFGGISFAAVEIAKIVFFVVLLMFVISVLFGTVARRPFL